MSDPLFSKRRLARDGAARKSVVVVGLPRSGSSFLSHVMSQMPDWYVFDDLYLAREARRVGGFETLTEASLNKLLFFLGWQIRARRKWGLYAIPNVAEEEVEPMNRALGDVFGGGAESWMDLQEEWLVRLAARAGARNWGYKMPGAFRHLDRLFDAYPDMKAVFLMRAPEKVLASYKHMPKGSEDGDPAQYHPVAHAIYWRMAARAWLSACARWPDRVMLLRFEDLVADPSRSAARLSEFLGTETPQTIVPPARRNTSFAGAKTEGLTGLEKWIVARVTGRTRRKLGFAGSSSETSFSLAGLGDFLVTTGRFLRFRAVQLIGRLKG